MIARKPRGRIEMMPRKRERESKKEGMEGADRLREGKKERNGRGYG